MRERHPIPTVEFYGESNKGLTPDLLHCEFLITRSRAHQFKIKPHRHPGLTQLFYLKNGTGEAHLDGEPTTLKAPCLIVITEMCIHDFVWSTDVDGYVLSISNPLLLELQQTLGKEHLIINSTMIMTIRKNQDELEQILALLESEYNRAQGESRFHALKSLMQLLSIWIERNASSYSKKTYQGDHRVDYFSRYQQLINSHFMTKRSVKSYAHELGITAPHLNSLCQEIIGKSALQLIHERTVLEAKRHLIYSVQSISQIAYELGFNDPAYFTRFFKRLTGDSPKQFRLSAPKDAG